MNKEKVLIKKCATYDQSEVNRCITDFLAQLNDGQKYVLPGQTVLLKPNMLSCKSPDRAVTTHPAIVQAVAQYFVKAGARVLIGDSPPAVFGRTEKYWQETGFKQAAEASGASLICFETQNKQTISFFSNNAKRQVHIVKTYFEADLVINLAKLKTHNLTRITGAIKNLFGLVPGLQKAVWHKHFPKSVDFSNFMTDLALQLPTHLTILDAIEGMEGQGPAGGDKIFPGFLLAAKCPVAIDLSICAIADLRPDSIPMLRRAHDIGWGPSGIEGLEFYGDSINEVKIKDFNVPQISIQDYLPDILLNSLKSLVWAGPVLKANTCISCKRCAEVCPVNAISINQQEAQFDRQTCISCFCCMEVCPVDAIEARKSPLLNLAFRLKTALKRAKRS